MQSGSQKSYLKLHLIVFIWGFTALLGALVSLQAMSLVWYRMVLACVMVGAYALFTKKSLLLTRKQILRLLIAGFVIALHWYTFFKAIKVSNVSITLACLSSGAFFVSLLNPLMQKKRINWKELGLSTIGILGFCLIFSVEFHYWLGMTLAIISAILSAFFSVLNSNFVQKHHPVAITFYELLGGVILFSVFLAFDGAFQPSFWHLSMSDWCYLALLSSVCTAYAFIGSVDVMKYLSPYTVMLTINLEPIYGIILAVLFLGKEEHMHSAFYIGVLLILGTLIWNAIMNKKTIQ
ncbi:MAG: EamA family transporter [Flavobacterium sp. BFFFF2]|nr:MAG: EamA family transporter [Flavobacterium sp. BFFFF2]